MLFNSAIFLFAFLPLTYLVFWKLRTKNARYFWLAITGYVFYGWWSFKFCFLMLFSTLVAYFAGLGILRASTERQRRFFLIASVVVDLSLLGFFKYFNFASENLNQLLQLLGFEALIPHLNIILPVGISFYTFHTMSYVIDAYRGTIRPTTNFFEFSCYVSLFSQLVAGPIVRFRQIEADLENIDHGLQTSAMEHGISYFTLGLAKKVLIADSLASFVDPGFQNIGSTGTLGAWMLVLGYTYQLYFDFSGYSDMAIGLGSLFGIRIPINFDSPYKATDPSDFWRRWHISLSSWLRDYLYISLGGNRRGESRTLVNLMLTMLLGGLWHGAQWTFVVWGFLHGLFLVIHRVYRRFVSRPMPKFPAQVLMFLAVAVGWVFFRAATIGDATDLLARMFSATQGEIPGLHSAFPVVLLFAAVIAHFAPNTHELPHRYSWSGAIAATSLFTLCLLRIFANANSPFLYFQF